jgi:hypothetical protein
MKLNIGRDFEIMKKAVADLGQEQAVKHLMDSVASGKLAPEEFRLPDLYESLDSTAFPKATAALIHKKVIDGYNNIPGIGDMLVTRVPSSLKQETIVGFNAAEGPKQVLEGMPYEDSSISEKYVTITNRKFGRLISVTEEAIMFDQTGQLLQRAYQIGEKAAYYREKEIVECVIDSNTTSWYPSGSATDFYSSTNGNTVSGGGGVINETTLQLVKNLIDDQTDSNGDFVLIDQRGMVLLVPPELEVEAWQIMNATDYGVRGAHISTGTNTTPMDYFPVPNYYRGRYRVLSSPFLSTATSWYLGDFKRDFWWTEVYPIQIQQKQSDEDKFHRDVVAHYKVRYFGRCGAVDYIHSYECTN